MGFLKKLISSLKTEDDGFSISQEPFDDDGNSKEKRIAKRIMADNNHEFCIFISPHNEEPDMEKAPFLMANLIKISFKGAAFSCYSTVACTPYDSNIEEKLKPSSDIWLVPNSKIDMNSCCMKACKKTEKADSENMENIDPIKGKILWVKTDQFGCAFKDDSEKLTKLIENLRKDGFIK